MVSDTVEHGNDSDNEDGGEAGLKGGMRGANSPERMAWSTCQPEGRWGSITEPMVEDGCVS
jgi:hypothetical protein